MLKAIIPATHAHATETVFVENQEIMTCEFSYLENGDLCVFNHHDIDSQFWAFVDELLMFLPFGTEVKISRDCE